jgi:hypothetical protein
MSYHTGRRFQISDEFDLKIFVLFELSLFIYHLYWLLFQFTLLLFDLNTRTLILVWPITHRSYRPGDTTVEVTNRENAHSR